jgi:cellulose synthase/poly-beta-1,6-N-acetylglucosamine synthase-like glycosyltransferase/peptidoglycan/xylan/chitin deacetylase (PgdA/CDA1 family)
MRRPVVLVMLALALAVLARADVVSAALVAVGGFAAWLLVRHRRRSLAWVAAVWVVVGVTVVVALAALAVPTYHQRRDPLLVPADLATIGDDVHKRAGTFELNGYVVSDNDNAVAGVDAQSPSVSTVSSTGGLVNPDGSFAYVDQRNTLVHAHLGGARAQLVVQNYDPTMPNGGDFSPALAHAVLATPASRDAFAQQVSAIVARDHWDGIVVDFEQVQDSDQPGLVSLLAQMRGLLPSRARLMVAVPVRQSDNPSSLGYDIAALARNVDVVQLMTYDQNDPTSDPGPIASLPWTQAAITSALASVPADKLQIGAAEYGYAWGPSAARLGQSFSPAQARRWARDVHLIPRWSVVDNGWHVVLPDGTKLYWQDSRSAAATTRLAVKDHLEGAAVWDLSNADPLAAVAAKLPLDRVQVNTTDARGIQVVKARGLVALTFDDGPDPTWTPQILAILRTYGVPGTFFDIGMNAEAHPELVQQEISSGDIVANHTYSHLDLTQIPQWRAALEIRADNWVIQGITGREPVLFRSPYGAQELTDAQSAAHQDIAASLGMQPVGWNVDPLDWARPGVDRIVSAATSSTAMDQIILLHDGGGDRSQTVAALPRIIETLRAKGYRFVTPDQLDASVGAPYRAVETGFWNVARDLTSIATYKLWVSAHEVTLWALAIVGLLSLARLIVSFPLAVAHRRRSRRRRASWADDAGRAHTVTVLIPAHDEAATIAATMAAVAGLDGPVVQVIIAENGSSDDTAELARAASVLHPHVDWEVRELGPVGKAAALNTCLQDVVGDVVVVLDADTLLEPDFLRAALPHFDDPAVGAVAGNVKVGNRHSMLGRLQAYEYVVSLGLDRRAQAQLGVVSVVPGAAGAFRREALVRVGGWPSRTLTEDADLTVELLSAGWQVPYESAAVSWTEAPATAREILRQRRRWSYGTTQVSELHSYRMLRREHGRVGLLGLPWLTLSQVVLPGIGPIVDLFLLWLVLNGDWRIALGMFAVALVLDVAVSAWALRAEGESMRLLAMAPAARLVWRPLLLVAVSGSLRAWLTGRSVSWNQARRHNTAHAH